MPEDIPMKSIAIIGMAGRYPGAVTVHQFWENLCQGRESISYFSDDELAPEIPIHLKQDPNYVRARGIIEDIDKFDAKFFDIPPREAEIMDPQQRIFMEIAWESLEDAGYYPEAFDGLIGIYAGMNNNTYYLSNVLQRPDAISRVGEFQTMLANEKDFLTTRISYKLNLTGPSVNIFTACSTSLVAVCLAVDSLLSFQCDMALAGGISIIIPQNSGYLYQEGSMLSPDGHCRPFDIHAQGTTFNSGAGIVVLKRLEDALEDQDHIYALILGCGVNNDGSTKVSFTAPSVGGQAEAIAMAYAQADVPHETISYIEAHGTGTPLGDPIEVAALSQVFQETTSKLNFCALGSVKSNVGHLVHAAGLAGLSKTALALENRIIPPSINFKEANPKLELGKSPFYVNETLVEWPENEYPRRAGVSSLGVGGTNAHVVLQEPPSIVSDSSSRPRQLLLLSAKNEDSLNKASENFLDFLKANPDINLADVSYTLQVGRKPFKFRRFFVCPTTRDKSQDFVDALSKQEVSIQEITQERRPVIFMFPGQGSQYIFMGANLYETEPLFRQIVDQCSEALYPLLNLDLRSILYPSPDKIEQATHELTQTRITQPALFVIEYALARLWMSWGILPEAMIGHSIGEFVAATIADVFSLDEALKLIATRAKMMQELPKGAMLSVRISASDLKPRIPATLSLAAVNAPKLCVVSGPTQEIEFFQKELEQNEIICRLLHTSHAFHSAMIEPIIEPFIEVLHSIRLSPPQISFISNVTGKWITKEQAISPEYWAQHMRSTVRFAEGINTLWEDPNRILLEVGPRTTATTLARQQIRDRVNQLAISSLGVSAENSSEWETMLTAIGRLWTLGTRIDWQSFYSNENRFRISLPTYPFTKTSFWVEPAQQESAENNQPEIAEVDSQQNIPIQKGQTMNQQNNFNKIQTRLIEVLEDSSGIEIQESDMSISLLDLGFDSLFLTQASTAISNEFGVSLTFRQLLEEFTTLKELCNYIESNLPAEFFTDETSNTISPPAEIENAELLIEKCIVPQNSVESVITMQLKLMENQLATLQASGKDIFSQKTLLATISGSINDKQSTETKAKKVKESTNQNKKAFGPGLQIKTAIEGELNAAQKRYIESFTKRYSLKTAGSKKLTQSNRKHLADPRSASGFNPLLKEVIYPIVTKRSSGSKLWDIDNNEYIDLLNGFGSNFFGHSPPFVIEAVTKQLKEGIEIGPQTPLAGEVAELICEFTGLDRVAFCNTGSEAVLGSLRIARTVTGRKKIALFTGAYHGINDEVIVKGTKKLRSIPAAPGIPPSAVENTLVLDYGTEKSLEILKQHKNELAAILVEPVQSRMPELQPKDFLHQVREMTQEAGIALIFDEVVTGFRTCPGGAQEHFGIQADLATYGKVVGGGMPIGVIAGKSSFMDALDGGFWQYGDESIPTVGVTYFAGTFVRHPPALAAAKSVLLFMKNSGPDLQAKVNQRTNQLVEQLNLFFCDEQFPIKITHFASVMKINFTQEVPLRELLYLHLREKGIHIWDNRPAFLTMAHTEEDVEFIIKAFKESVMEMRGADFFPPPLKLEHLSLRADSPPVPGAKLGRDPQGNPAWFIADPQRPGKYLKVAGEDNL